MKEEKPYKRRTVFINKSFQIRFSLLMFSLFFLAAFMVWLELYEAIIIISKKGIILDPTVALWLNRLNAVLVWKTGLSLGLVWVLSIFISHYIAGPIYRIEKTLKAMGDGDLSMRVHLRRFDEFKFLADCFNTSLDALTTTLNKDRSKLLEISDELAKMADDKKPDATKLRDLCQQIKDVQKDIKLS